METSDNNATSSPASVPDNSRRRSGRVVRAPQKFSPQPNPSQNQNDQPSKRKRGPDHDDEDAENGYPEEAEEEEEEQSDPDDEDDDAEEAPSSRSRKTKSKQRSRPKKPAVKRAKVNGSTPVDAVSASNATAMKLPNRPKKTARVVIAHPDGDGLYGENKTEDTCALKISNMLTHY